MQPDSIYIQSIRSDDSYDYLNEINGKPEEKTSGNHTTSTIGYSINNLANSPLVSVFAYLFVTIIITFIVIKIIHKFSSEGKDHDDILDRGLGTDTIYGHSWDEEIKEYMDKENYSELIVLLYLHWLETLNADGTIIFTISKTPGIYLKEVMANAVGNEAILNKTTTLTDHYLRIRYGHKKATKELADQLLSL